MNIAPVSIRTLLRALTRPMPMKAPRQDASAAPSSERTEGDRTADGGNRDEAGVIKKPVILQQLSPVLPPNIHQNTCHVYPTGAGPAREILHFGKTLTGLIASIEPSR